MAPTPSPQASPVPDTNQAAQQYMSVLAEKHGLNPADLQGFLNTAGNRVFMGYGYGPSNVQQTEQYMSAFEAKKMISHWTYSALQQFAQSLYQQGILPAPVVNMKQLRAIWEEMVETSAAFTQAGQKVSPYDVLARYMQVPKKEDKNTVDGIRTTTQVSLFDPGAAAAAIDQLLTQRLGRSATEGEKRAFVSALNAALQENPTVTTTSPDGSSVVQQGTDPSAFADAYVKNKFGEEAGTYQAATRYFDAFEQLLAGPSSGVA